MGISNSKFEGIAHAQGEFLMFLDGDDWLEPDAIQCCIEPAEKYDIDMVIMSNQKVLYKGFPLYEKKNILPDCNRVISQPELFERYFSNFFGNNMYPVTYWGKLIRKSAFEKANLRPSPMDYSEDLFFNMRLFPYLRSMYMLDYIGYNWRWGGITSGKLKTTEKRIFKLLYFVIDMYNQRMEILNQYKYESGKFYMTSELVDYLIINLSKISNSQKPSNDIKDLISKYLDIFRENIKYLDGKEGGKYDVIRTFNVKTVYQYCFQKYRNDFIKRNIKRILHVIAG